MLWSKGMRIRLGGGADGDGRKIEAAGRELKHGFHLLRIYVKLLYDFFNIRACFKVLEDGGACRPMLMRR
jgi:hypothetical protein